MCCACVAAFSVLAFGETLNGRLLDAGCYDQQKSATSCDPTGSTASFAILVSGKAYKLDDSAKVAAALKNRADRSTDPGKTPSRIMAKVTGTKDGDMVKVEEIEVQ